MKQKKIYFTISLICILSFIMMVTGCGSVEDTSPSVQLQTITSSLEIQETITVNASIRDVGTYSVSWNITEGNGSIIPVTDLQVIFKAPKSAGTSKISATVVGGGHIITAEKSLTITLPDTTPPTTPENIALTADDRVITVTWTINTEQDLAGYTLYYSTTPGQYQSINVGNVTSYDLKNLQNNQMYYIRLSAYDAKQNTSIPTLEVSSKPIDNGAPSTPVAFQASESEGNVVITWLNPEEADLEGVKILRKEAGFPEGPEDSTATVIFDSKNNDLAETVTDTTIETGKLYYYRAYSYDEIPNYSDAAQDTIIVTTK